MCDRNGGLYFGDVVQKASARLRYGLNIRMQDANNIEAKGRQNFKKSIVACTEYGCQIKDEEDGALALRFG